MHAIPAPFSPTMSAANTPTTQSLSPLLCTLAAFPGVPAGGGTDDLPFYGRPQ